MDGEYNGYDIDTLSSESVRAERLVLTTGWLPSCIGSKEYDCYDCPLDNVGTCPVRSDDDYCSYLLWLHDRYVSQERQRRQRIKILKNILKKHRLPLHWEVLAALAFREAPKLFESAHSIRGLVYNNSDVFVMKEDGVFGLSAWRR